MTLISQPSVTVSKVPASSAVGNAAQKVLFVGQKLTAGTATAGALYSSIENDGSEDTLFGAGSMLSNMIKAAKKINNISRFDAISLADAESAVAATGTIAFSGTATAAGSLNIYVGSKINNKYVLPVALNATAASLATALAALINADTKAPVTAAADTVTVTLTARNKGLEGNKIGIAIDNSVAGITTTLTAFANGTLSPTLTNIFSVLGDERYQTVVFPSSYEYDFVTKDFLDGRFNVDDAMMQGVAICGLTDTLSNLKTAANALNTQSLVILGDKTETGDTHKGSSMLELDYVKAAQFAAFRALKFTDGIDLSRYIVTTGGALDYFGGTHMASFPYFNTPMPYLPLVPQGKGFTKTEIEELYTVGISILGNNLSGTSVLCGEIVTTYKTDVASNPDETWKYLESVDTASAGAEYMFNNLKKDYAQSRLTEGDLIAGYSMANEGKIRATFSNYYGVLSSKGYVLFEAGDEAIKAFQDSLIISIDKIKGKISATMKPVIVSQLRGIQALLQIAFSVK